MQVIYSVQIEDFAESHFIKKFRKKYKNYWDHTLIAIKAGLERLDALLLTDKAETIIDADDLKIIKTKFRVPGTKESAKTSGNRCIVYWYAKKQCVSILLVYTKTDLSGTNETAEWKRIIKDNYPEFKNIL